jgi:elongation factor P hydroxylase
LFWLPLLKYDQDSDFIIDFIRATFEWDIMLNEQVERGITLVISHLFSSGERRQIRNSPIYWFIVDGRTEENLILFQTIQKNLNSKNKIFFYLSKGKRGGW